MDINKLQRLARLLEYSDQPPPQDVLCAVAGLVDMENAETDPALLSWKVEKDATTTWNVFGLTPEEITTVTATADRVPWTLDSEGRGEGHAAADSLTAVARPRASVSHLAATAVEDVDNRFDRRPTEWRSAWRIHFDDGKTFDLPTDQEPKTNEAARALLEDLRSR